MAPRSSSFNFYFKIFWVVERGGKENLVMQVAAFVLFAFICGFVAVNFHVKHEKRHKIQTENHVNNGRLYLLWIKQVTGFMC